MADFEADAVSDEEKLKIVEQFISQTPPGEFNSVFNDVRILLDNDVALKGSQSFLKYDLDQMEPVKVGDENVVLSSKGAKDGKFLAPNSATRFAYDPLRKEATPEAAGDGTGAKDNLRAALQAALQLYVADHFEHGTCSVYSNTVDSQVELTALIESHRYQPHNFYNGKWRSIWTVLVDSANQSAKVSGLMKLQVHYYEDGNVQLLTNKKKEGDGVTKASVTWDSEESLVSQLMNIVEKEENAYQMGVASVYQTFSDKTFRMLRRALPVTQAKINWDQIAAYKIGAELKSQ